MAYYEFNLSSSLYHYTSIEALKIIVTSGNMRLSRSDQTNDPFEVVFVRDRILESLRTLHGNATKRFESIFWKRCLDTYETVSDPRRFFLSCFSMRKDSLPMWRLYSQEGNGIVFGFRPRAFEGFDCRLTPVKYLPNVGSVTEHVQETVARSVGETLPPELNFSHVPFVLRLIEATVSTKQSYWDYEQEYRLSFSMDDEQYASIEDIVDPETYRRMSAYHPTNPGLSDDKQFLFQRYGFIKSNEIDRSRAISELVLGPSCEWSEEDARVFLSEQGFVDFNVSRSNVTWR